MIGKTMAKLWYQHVWVMKWSLFTEKSKNLIFVKVFLKVWSDLYFSSMVVHIHNFIYPTVISTSSCEFKRFTRTVWIWSNISLLYTLLKLIWRCSYWFLHNIFNKRLKKRHPYRIIGFTSVVGVHKSCFSWPC